MGIIEDIQQTIGKIVKEEDSNIKQIVLTFLSAFTNNPQNTRILAPSSEGKTYLVTKIASLFPEEYIIPLAQTTPKGIRYCLISGKIIENGNDNWQDYDTAINPLEEELGKTKDKEKQQELKNQIKQLRESACDKIDFTNKILVFLDSQSFEAFEDLKPVLSHDLKHLKSFSVNKSKSGSLEAKKILSINFPAVIYCSAKDEHQQDKTNEINTRFNSISLNTSSKKYRKMLEFEAIHSGLPDSIFQDEVLCEEEIEELKQKIYDLIEEIKGNSETLNPFTLGISNLLPSDGGYRTRQLKILNNNIKMCTLVNHDVRPKIIIDSIKIPIVTRVDIEEACKLTKEPREIQPYKIKIFNESIRPIIIQHGRDESILNGNIKCLTASEILEHLDKSIIGRQKLQETILKPLVDQGFLEESIDPSNKSRYIYYLPQRYQNKEAVLESTLIDVSLLDESCLNLFIDKYIKQRFDNRELTIEDKNEIPINPEELIVILKNRHSPVQNSHKLDSNETSKDIEVMS